MRRSAPPSSRWVANEWRNVCGLTRSARSARDRCPCLLAGEPPAAIAEEERAAAERRDVAEGEERDARAAHPASEPVEGDVADRYEPFLVALADDPDEGTIDREVLAV